MSHKKFFALFLFGLLIGVLVFVAPRVVYYAASGLAPNMAPQIAFYFAPLLWLLAVPVALIGEVALHRVVPARTGPQAMLVGASYATLLLWWALPGSLWIMLLINPVVARLALRRAWPNNSSKPTPLRGAA
ncbi:hypothetical protein ACFFGH_33930 [Lysobacter korlensis]|uniref:Uncharacterized protein n=1 Tax=Lysobacter korlensis TaxID=553636 RepID=A0ABV6S0V1_9GAMM